ncbi:tRNA (5-methylaminomethyl-2-thiouridine)(34)-methyltransferase MnmD [Raineya orbicola]|jgi:tRNA U34 5-methylaminomethyl-2-thiouridine-forming methyltransferase MnmC|uniref:S-adenosyl-L-methionine-dependent methyltransferase n=1 Tax=Raineya orbicola TaxID=2016530 RepID=A0A2N3IHD5_9BACT|nr:tRNA (5-methylaminomethyl-2-thiouridine)(34)-methyltransferase MnmD [Raineya orbicola]PKQ69633.1 S-adenosyl-L-methionine-dependent methyltransferase [Raineya orbicola]
MLTLYTTTDGSKTLLNTALNETYHSRNGSIAESLYVFLQAGLHDWLSENPNFQDTIRILEIGFGTGLNALLTLQSALQKNLSIYYQTLEIYPLTYEQIKPLGYVEQVDSHLETYFEAMHQAEWDKPVPIADNFVLEKRKIALQAYQSDAIFDIVYFDAFAPNVQPELWEIEQIRRTTNAMRKGAFWVTYSAKGQLRRDLKTLGLQVEKLPGALGKREMTRARKM